MFFFCEKTVTLEKFWEVKHTKIEKFILSKLCYSNIRNSEIIEKFEGFGFENWLKLLFYYTE